VGTDQRTGCGILSLLDCGALATVEQAGDTLRVPLASTSALRRGVLSCLRFAPSKYSQAVRVTCTEIRDADAGTKRVCVSGGPNDPINYYFRFPDVRTPRLIQVQLNDALLNYQLKSGHPLSPADRALEEARLAGLVENLMPSGWVRISSERPGVGR
jgi:hypothetical protein